MASSHRQPRSQLQTVSSTRPMLRPVSDRRKRPGSAKKRTVTQCCPAQRTAEGVLARDRNPSGREHQRPIRPLPSGHNDGVSLKFNNRSLLQQILRRSVVELRCPAQVSYFVDEFDCGRSQEKIGREVVGPGWYQRGASVHEDTGQGGPVRWLALWQRSRPDPLAREFDNVGGLLTSLRDDWTNC